MARARTLSRIYSLILSLLLSLLLASVLPASLVLAPSEAAAQSTGGSFGGGSFGGGGSSSSSSSSSSSWGGGGSSSSTSFGGGSSSWGGGSTSPGASGGGGGGVGALCCLVFVGMIVLLFVVIASKRQAKSKSQGYAPSVGGPLPYHGPDAMYLSSITLGIDWRARREIQQRLEELARTGDTGSPQGLANLLRETVLSLRRAEMAWLYVSFKNLGPFRPQDCEAQFQQLATSARAAFRHELVRAQAGQVAQVQEGPAMRVHANEGEGTVVVHLIVAAKRQLMGLNNPDANQIRAALDNRAGLTAQQMVALEVVWSPAAENDRMSTSELEQNYPDLRLIDPNSIAGRIFCSYCTGPFAMELLNCPHCGAPAQQSQGNRAPPRSS